MNRKVALSAICAVLITVLACNLGSSAPTVAPDYGATITAQAGELESQTAEPSATVENATATSGPTATSTAEASAQNPAPLAATAGPTAPKKPKNLQGKGAATSIQLTWDDDALNETGFRIYQAGVVAPVASLDAHSATGGMSYSVGGLACGFKAKYSVRAYNDQGESGSSNSVDGATVPCTPQSLVGTGQGNAISFVWEVGMPHNEDGFRLYQQGVSAPVATHGPNVGGGSTYLDVADLACNLVGKYSVRAFNSAGESPPSNPTEAETVPCPPSGLEITGTTKDTVNYSWTDNATNELGYHVYKDDVLYVSLPAHPGTGPTGSDAFQLCGKTVVYAVRAYNYAGESGWSEHIGATTLGC